MRFATQAASPRALVWSSVQQNSFCRPKKAARPSRRWLPGSSNILCTEGEGAECVHKTKRREPDGCRARGDGREATRRHDPAQGKADGSNARKELRVKKVRRVGNGWLGRARTRGRMRSHNRGYVGSEKALGHANRRMAQSWRYAKGWR